MNGDTTRRWMSECSVAITAKRDYLTQLDSAIGDADHGANMTRGFSAVESKLKALDGATPGKLLITAGSTLVSTVGGASGPLWGSALRRAGKVLGENEEIEAELLADALDGAIYAIVEIGRAEPGEKTMIDALSPASRALREAIRAGKTLPHGLAAARVAAEHGARATVPMVAKKGRASYLGERSAGHQDPGATSAALIIAALERAVAQP